MPKPGKPLFTRTTPIKRDPNYSPREAKLLDVSALAFASASPTMRARLSTPTTSAPVWSTLLSNLSAWTGT